jgi:hypothetical protein
MNTQKVLLLGASTNPERYAYMAAKLLLQKSYEVILVGIKAGNLNSTKIETDKNKIFLDIDTITLYVGAKNQPEWYEYILKTNPRRIIFNPGTENPELYEKAKQQGIECIEACTLVLLRTGQF